MFLSEERNQKTFWVCAGVGMPAMAGKLGSGGIVKVF
jgi:ABC-type methionine transport system permease subunit